ncbi:hypothetical protein [Pedobacter sp. GR22-6]|uniref:hypothetical protein n=1 Tax=Pedobacter sp. GR22-6 TaxID=3127957 RepID=UPI00307EA204
MQTCKLCQKNAADKTNTHYLTDGIIRSCLNEDGSNKREKGMAFNISLEETSIEARFQRSTSREGIMRNFGREASEEEIEAAKKPLFAVDHVFCSGCEKKFTDIENPFIREVLPILRGKDFSGEQEIAIDHPSVRPFFLLQVYRTAICDRSYKLSKEKIETLRKYFDNAEGNIDEVKSIPLHVTYLNTLGGENQFTTNSVGIGNNNNNRCVFFNDFVIQTSSDDSPIDMFDYHGLNNEASLKIYTNQNEDAFKVRLFSNDQRIAMHNGYHIEKAKKFKENYRKKFSVRYFLKYGSRIHPSQVEEFVNAVIHSEEVNDESKYSTAHFEKICDLYLDKFKP